MPVRVIAVFVAAALAEILGCFLILKVVRNAAPLWWLILAALSLAVFGWLLALPGEVAGRTYAAYGGIYVAMAVAWMMVVEDRQPDRWDLIGAAITLVGMGIITFAPHRV